MAWKSVLLFAIVSVSISPAVRSSEQLNLPTSNDPVENNSDLNKTYKYAIGFKGASLLLEKYSARGPSWYVSFDQSYTSFKDLFDEALRCSALMYSGYSCTLNPLPEYENFMVGYKNAIQNSHFYYFLGIEAYRLSQSVNPYAINPFVGIGYELVSYERYFLRMELGTNSSVFDMRLGFKF